MYVCTYVQYTYTHIYIYIYIYCGALFPCGSNRTSCGGEFSSDTDLSRVLVSVTGNKRNSLEDMAFIGRHLYNYNYSHHNNWSGPSSPLVALVLLSWSSAC
jgi:hypothetical protein